MDLCLAFIGAISVSADDDSIEGGGISATIGLSTIFAGVDGAMAGSGL